MSDDPLLNKGELGPYQIEKKLGQGAMGGVYLGMHRVLQVHHAIKVIHPKLLGDTTLLERFLREARNTAKLKHMNIVQVVGADQVDGIYYLAMEFVQGKTLEQMMRDPGLSIHDAVRYVHMIANALHYAHSRNIIHRDIKPANIMVNEEDVAKLMDFGLVRDQGQPEGGDSGEQLTMAGYIMGTPQYMPIEQWQGEGVDSRSDIYALGATAYVALTGKLPFPGKSARDIFRAVLTTQAKDVREHNPDIDEELAQVIHTAIQPEKEDRYQTAEQFALSLEQWWDHHPYQGTSLFKAPVMDDMTSAGGRTALQSSTRGRASQVGTRAVLTHGSTGQGSSPTSLDVTGKSKGPLIAVGALLVLIGLAVGAFFAMGGSKGNGNDGNTPPPPVFEIGIAADVATETNPVATNNSKYAIPGKGDVTLNDQPYTFGTALTLAPGMNQLKLAPAAGGEPRILFVLFDDSAPEITIPALEGTTDNIIPSSATTYTLKGKISDTYAGARDLTLLLKKDGEESRPVLKENGEFEFEFALGDADVAIDLEAADRADNRQVLRFWVVPDRATLKFEDAWMPANGWVTSRNFKLSGKLNKSRGVTLTIDGQQVTPGEYGNFSVELEREAGRHAIKYSAKDWFNREVNGQREIIVDLEPPVLEVTAPTETAFSFEGLPQQIEVKGTLDSNEAELTVNGAAVKPAGNGEFTAKVEAASFGKLAIEVKAIDPAGRATSKSLQLTIKQKKYRLLEKNAQGYQEYERVKDGMVMVEVPGAKFKRGGGGLGDAPEVTAEVSTFLIAKYEVTNDQFCTFLTSSGVTADEALGIRRWIVKDADGFFGELRPIGKVWSSVEGTGMRPVVNVTWAGALAYCEWADPDGSLPSEAQWEYAARGTDEREFPWGAELPDPSKANRSGSGRDARSDVDKQPDGASPFGLLNMAGNVEEWCRDWYTEGSYTRPDQQGKDPVLTTKPNATDYRVVRGGSFRSPLNRKPKPMVEDNERTNLQTFARGRRLPGMGADDLGFRPVAKPPAE
ncbi:MAG: SUMF1/EgtB/PvdO family nonheme iron enzyme [Planctomycetes bacterium]|nr:SUMF1/EgtB/PvdO family nonheme iron enzyme [Planctomycetota bacterium]